MSDPEDFLARWSRRKRETADEAERATAPAEPGETEGAQQGGRPVATDEPSAELTKALFDPTTLPSIESITAATDIRAFLAPGVPAELTRAALRRMWVADPKIRDFVGLADYDWDFNAAGSMHGFGALEMTDAIRDEIAQLFSPAPSAPAAAEVAPPDSLQPTKVAQEFTSDQCPLNASEPTLHPDQQARLQDEPHVSEDVTQCNKEFAALRREIVKDEDAQSIAARRHGGALPK
jgi:hypothetical protein